MTTRRQKNLLMAANIAILLGIVASISMAIALPPKAAQTALRSTHAPPAAAQAYRPGPLAEYAVIYQRDLRQAMFSSQAAQSSFNAKLTGTVLEPGFTYGIFRTSSGEDKIVSVGQAIEGAEVTAIEEGSATINYYGQTLTLKVQKKEEEP